MGGFYCAAGSRNRFFTGARLPQRAPAMFSSLDIHGEWLRFDAEAGPDAFGIGASPDIIA
jgi:hypothetical protein